MLRVSGNKIVNKAGRKVRLTGISLGGWLMIEGYMLGGRNIPEHQFKNSLGPKAAEFTSEFRKRFFNEADAERISKLGFNCVRIPFNYRLLEDKGGLELLADAVKWFSDRKIYSILDMHAVPGSQNHDWHSDSEGNAKFWEDRHHRDQYLQLWKLLSDRFKDNEFIAGYDIMNEPVTDKTDLLCEIYSQTIDLIRKNGDSHIIFLEGNRWAQDADVLDGLFSDNVALSIHFYEPTRFVFNFVPDAEYPGKTNGVQWNRARIGKFLKKYLKFGVPVYVGEFGVAVRCPDCNRELGWVRDVLKIFKQFGFHWTYWTYKSVAMSRYPDGIYRNLDEYDIFGRGSENPGMGTVVQRMKEAPEKVYRELETSRFVLNRKLMRVLEQNLTHHSLR